MEFDSAGLRDANLMSVHPTARKALLSRTEEKVSLSYWPQETVWPAGPGDVLLPCNQHWFSHTLSPVSSPSV